MSAAKHTPGPWVVDEATYTHVRAKALEYETLDGGITRPAVAQVLKFVVCEEREANAKLIAAAPALADALERIERETLHSADECNRCAARAALRAAGRLP